jgi:hypothetical protein
VAVGLDRHNGPFVSALRHSMFRVLFSVQPVPLAQDRDAVAPRPATDAPPAAALSLARLRTPRDPLQPLLPQRARRRALAPRVAQRRRRVSDHVRLTHRLTAPLQHSFSHALPWSDDHDPTRVGDCFTPWPTLNAAQRARRPLPREPCCRAHHVRDAHGIDQRLQALKRAPPRTTEKGVIAPHVLWVQALVAQLRGRLPAIADVEPAIAPRARRPPDCPGCAALPGAGAVLAPRLLGACGALRDRSTAADALQP